MTTTAAAPTTTAADRLRALLLVDGVGTAVLGVAALLAAEPLADEVGSPLGLRIVGVLFLVVGADMLLTRRADGGRLTADARLLGVADLAFAVVALGALAVVDATALGVGLVVAVAVVCLGMGTAKLALTRR